MTPDARPLTMQDRLLVAAHVEMLASQDPTIRVIADTVVECVRCCDYFPECAHVVDESARVDAEEGRLARRAEQLQHAADEYMSLSLMSYHGDPSGTDSMLADLTEDDVRHIRLLILELATALSEECGLPMPPAEHVL